MPGQGVAVAAALTAGAVGLAIAASGGSAQEPVAATSGDVAELVDIEVDQGAGMGMLIAADRLAGGRSRSRRRLMRQRTKTAYTVEGASPTWGAIWAGPRRWGQRRRTIRRTTGAGSAGGSGGGGWTDRPSRPAPDRDTAGPIDQRSSG
jgi:hypothetical protein